MDSDTGNNYNKLAKIWSDCYDDTEAFQNLDKTERSNTEVTTGTELVKRLDVFSSWTMNKPNTILYVKNSLLWSPDVMEKSIGIVCVILERGKYCVTYRVMKDRNHKTWM